MRVLETLPSVLGKSKEELLSVLLNEEYGYFPSVSCRTSVELQRKDVDFLSGKAELQVLGMTCISELGSHTFPVYYVLPNQRTNKLPAIIHINFKDELPELITRTFISLLLKVAFAMP